MSADTKNSLRAAPRGLLPAARRRGGRDRDSTPPRHTATPRPGHTSERRACGSVSAPHRLPLSHLQQDETRDVHGRSPPSPSPLDTTTGTLPTSCLALVFLPSSPSQPEHTGHSGHLCCPHFPCPAHLKPGWTRSPSAGQPSCTPGLTRRAFSAPTALCSLLPPSDDRSKQVCSLGCGHRAGS